MRTVILIQGIFFQEDVRLGTGFDSGIGTRVTVTPALVHAMFQGLFQPAVEGQGRIGVMSDHFGESELTDGWITDSELRFTKRYQHRGDLIHYRFRKTSSGWIGTYAGDAVGRGTARCILSEISTDFFNQPTVDLDA